MRRHGTARDRVRAASIDSRLTTAASGPDPREGSGRGGAELWPGGDTPRWPHLWIVRANRPRNARLPRPRIARLREQSQLDFEIEFLGRLLDRDPYFVDAPCGSRRPTWRPRVSMPRALQLDRRLVRLTPEDAIAWYNLACSYTVLGMIDPGFFALQRALELGYDCAGRLRRDPDLKALRRDPRFDRLLRRFGFRV